MHLSHTIKSGVAGRLVAGRLVAGRLVAGRLVAGRLVAGRLVAGRLVPLVLAGALALAPSACTVDVGPQLDPPQGCNAPTAFFASDVWPKYFATYSCGQSTCHDAQSGRGYFRLMDVSAVTAPNPMAPLSAWPFEWQQNLRNVQQNLSCSDPTNSLVLAVPSGRSIPHPPGQTVTDVPGADALFTQWLQ